MCVIEVGDVLSERITSGLKTGIQHLALGGISKEMFPGGNNKLSVEAGDAVIVAGYPKGFYDRKKNYRRVDRPAPVIGRLSSEGRRHGRGRPEARRRRRPDPDRSEAAGHGRPGAARKTARAELAHAGDRDVGVRHGRKRGGGDEEGRGRFSSQAVFAGSPDGGGGEGARSPQAARREPRAARSAGPAVSVRKHHRP